MTEAICSCPTKCTVTSLLHVYVQFDNIIVGGENGQKKCWCGMQSTLTSILHFVVQFDNIVHLHLQLV